MTEIVSVEHVASKIYLVCGMKVMPDS